MSDLIDICRSAWNASKGASQPDYDDLVEGYRAMLTARAEGVIATGEVSEDQPFQAFERAVIDGSKSVPSPIADDIAPLKIEIVDEPEIEAVPGPSVEVETPKVELPAETLEEAEAARLDRARRREEAMPESQKPKLKKPARKSSPKTATKKAAKKIAPKK